MLNLQFGGAVVYVLVSSSCAECKLFEIRGSIFHVGDPILIDFRVTRIGLVSQATPLNLREKEGLVTTRTSCTSARNPCATNQVRDFEILCSVS